VQNRAARKGRKKGGGTLIHIGGFVASGNEKLLTKRAEYGFGTEWDSLVHYYQKEGKDACVGGGKRGSTVFGRKSFSKFE